MAEHDACLVVSFAASHLSFAAIYCYEKVVSHHLMCWHLYDVKCDFLLLYHQYAPIQWHDSK